MRNEYEKNFLSAEILFPEAARRVEILEALKKSWAGVVRPAIARHSTPYNLGVNEISIAIDDETIRGMLKGMKGNILRALLRFCYEPDGEFNLNITNGVPKNIPAAPKKLPFKPDIEISDEEVKNLMKDAPETLPEDINYAISHLKIFLEKRFPAKN